MTAHAGHRSAVLLGRGPGGAMVGGVVCNCGQVLRWLPRCGVATRRGTPCGSLVRTDLGYSACWSHGEGAGRTNRPRELRALGSGKLGERVSLSRQAL
jgi:hypothetical protein